MGHDYQTTCNQLLDTLNPKQKEVLSRRFGLCRAVSETLQNIGVDFNITRERVRQIEADSFKKLTKAIDIHSGLKTILTGFNSFLEENGGVKREDLLLSHLAVNEAERNCVYFLLALGPCFSRTSETEYGYSFWANSDTAKDKVKTFISLATAKLKTATKPLPEKVVCKLVSFENTALLGASLEIAKQVEKSPLGEYGLVSWAEIKPRGVRDAIYLVLSHYKKPLHFRDIANLSNNLGGKGVFAHKKVLPQTVHNELIRDQRFILVGRGLYALSDWGYENGTVKEVIKTILTQSKTPLSKQEIVEKVRTKKVVKDNTVCLNLADKHSFFRDDQGKYTIKTA